MLEQLRNACRKGELEEVNRLIGLGVDIHYDNKVFL
jgi:hypothetical protein